MKRTTTSVILAGLMSLGLAACSATGTTNSSTGSSTSGSMGSGANGTVPMTESPANPAPKANGNVGISGETGNISGNGTNTSSKTTDPNTSR